MDKNARTLIISMIQDAEQNKDPKFKDRLSIMSDFSLKISDVVLQDAKVYVCQVGLGIFGTGENRTELRVSNIDIRIAHIKESSGLITVQSTLLAQVTKEDRKAHFHCQVNYSLAGINKTSKSESFQINVHYPSENISLVIDAQSPMVKEGDNVTLRCEADGNPAPEYTFSKMKEGNEEDLPDVLGGKLSFHDLSRNDSGIYVCKAFDLQILRELNASANLFVNYLDVPTIAVATLKQRKHQWERDLTRLKHLLEGDSVFLTCSATGSRPLEFQWEKKGKLIAKGEQLNLTSVTYTATGDYTCRVTMPDIPDLFRSKSIPLAVHATPQLAPQEDLLFVKEGELLNLTCSAFSLSKTKVTWSPKNLTNHQHKSVLSVYVTKALLESGINCTAENKIGRAEHQFRLELRPEVAEPDNRTGPTKQESKGVIIVAVVVCIMAISILGAVLYFLHKKGKLPCGRSGKQEITRPEAHKDEIVVEVKSDKLPEEAGLLQGANGEKRSASDQDNRKMIAGRANIGRIGEELKKALVFTETGSKL
ncbi:hypothetical protein JD844_031505 [Phrynosoma platyrhinos]|uniref:Ig-like domain-containing protein n=1 Tax=Phrynosoma platyrhinos TaxID=52577 RepID=A0ABQ7T1G5_PHRPL|nr:hypothetical protein JD844_031505 [Phrynosoma platyrhinos]